MVPLRTEGLEDQGQGVGGEVDTARVHRSALEFELEPGLFDRPHAPCGVSSSSPAEGPER